MKENDCGEHMHRAHCCCAPRMGHRPMHPPMHPPMGHCHMEMSPEEEVEALKKHREMLEKRLERISERIEKLSA